MTDKVFNRLEVEIKKTYYVSERYKITSSFILIHHEKKLTIKELSMFLRGSDKILEIDENTFFVIFTFTSEEQTFKASENILLELDRHFNSRDSYISMEALDTSNSPRMVINKLLQILSETRKSSYSRIEGESILNSNL